MKGKQIAAWAAGLVFAAGAFAQACPDKNVLY